MIISFAWTTQALLEGRKTVTRRIWAPRTVASIKRAFDEGRRIHEAWDKLPHAGGKRVGYIELTERPRIEHLRDMPESDLEAEGGLWATTQEFRDMFVHGATGTMLPPLVIRFKWLGQEASHA